MNKDKAVTLESAISVKRSEWRAVRIMRLERKSMLLKDGYGIHEIRREKAYEVLRKKQKSLSKELRHLEKELCRISF
jgi:hypothetical protein